MIDIRKALESENVSEDKIKKVLKELGIDENKRWDAVVGEEYWCVSTYGLIFLHQFDDSVYSKYLKSIGNIFKTKQEAQNHLYKINFLSQMKIDFEDNSDEIDWSDYNQKKCSVCFDHFKNKIISTWWGSVQNQGVLCTTNEEWLKQYIIDNEQQIKKYCFGIE